MKYKCVTCGKESDYENDNLYEESGMSICASCAREHNASTVEFLKHRQPTIGLTVGEIVVWYNAFTGKCVQAWTNHGYIACYVGVGLVFPDAVAAISAMIEAGTGQCTTCKEVMATDCLQQGHFAARLCPKCYDASCSTGPRCTLCRKSYNECCC